MAIGINGSSNTITGIAVGGLPDGIVDTDMLAADAVTAAKIGSKTFTSYAVITDVKSTNANGGSLTSGNWRTRDLNTETTDEDGIVSLSSNQFTLGAGTYLIQYFAPACQINSHQARLYNITDSSEVSRGTAEYAGLGSNMPQTISYGFVRLTLSGSKVFELQHRCSTTVNNYGMGVGSAGGFSWGDVKFASVIIFKEA